MIPLVRWPLIALAACCTIPAANAATCTPLQFDASGTAKVEAAIPGIVPLCYSFQATAGQHANIALSREDEMVFGVAQRAQPDDRILADGRHDYSMTTEHASYDILLGAAAVHGNTAHQFRLTVTLK